MTDRELLEQLFGFMVGRSYVSGTRDSIRDMVQRYAQPPLTAYHSCCMQMTKGDYQKLSNLLNRIDRHLHPKKETTDAIQSDGNGLNRTTGDLSNHADGQQ